MARIAVLFHERDRNPTGYVVHQLARFWESDGHDVRYLFGINERVPADILLMHVNLSVVPRKYQDFAAGYQLVLNRKISDIRKSQITENRVLPGDPWSGPVIVKSDLNYGGVPEETYENRWFERRWPVLQRIRRQLNRMGKQGIPLYTWQYRVVSSLQDVPAVWFTSPKIIVEKFLPEIEDGHYHLRICQFLGDRAVYTRLSSTVPVIKAGNSIKAEDIAPDPVVDEWRRRYDVDYGKIDYVVTGGTHVLLDINKTTSATRNYRPDTQLDQIRRHIAEGLYGYLG